MGPSRGFLKDWFLFVLLCVAEALGRELGLPVTSVMSGPQPIWWSPPESGALIRNRAARIGSFDHSLYEAWFLFLPTTICTLSALPLEDRSALTQPYLKSRLTWTLTEARQRSYVYMVGSEVASKTGKMYTGLR